MTFEIVTETLEVQGIRLPWRRTTVPAVFRYGENLTPERPHPPELIAEGKVFVSLSTLYELAEQDQWESQFTGRVLLLDSPQDLALEQAGLAVRETKGGYHGSDLLRQFMKEEGYL